MRRKTIAEIRAEIAKSPRLRTQPQVVIARVTTVHQATVSRIVRGRFVRWSPAVQRLCKYARIKCMTPDRMPALEASIQELVAVANRAPRRQRSVIKLLRLVRELSDTFAE